jgi:hypothetical protein
MFVHENLTQESTRSRRLRSIAIRLALVLVYLSVAVPDILHGLTKQLHQSEFASSWVATASARLDHDLNSSGHEWWSPTARLETALPPATRAVLWEVRKQAVDQPLHFLLTAGPIELSRYLVGVPWYGWAITPLLAYREWRQWPSKRWWDPPLDWAVLALGVIVATWRRCSGPPAESGPGNYGGRRPRSPQAHAALRSFSSSRPPRHRNAASIRSMCER